MAIRIYNTLTKQKEEFVPLSDPVRFYCCGMTPKFDPHLGHAKLFVTMDVLRRYLHERGYRVKYVQNFTDVDDKIIARGKRENLDPMAVARKYTDSYFRSMEALNVMPADVYPKATETIPGIIAMIEGLIAEGHAYAPCNGDVYYRVSSFASYGKLSHRSEDDGQAGARIAIDEAKEDPRDFALWKAAKAGEPAWPSPWGNGRPGWHIECSAMVREELGDQIDIHAGGPDLIFPHHENEIAQSEAFTHHEPFSRTWVHIGQLNVNNEKMAHSLENFTTVLEILEHHHPAVLRYYFLGQHYRTPVNFTPESLDGSRRALERLCVARGNLGALVAHVTARGQASHGAAAAAALITSLAEAAATAENEFYAAMDDDFNTAAALAAIQVLAREINRVSDTLTSTTDAVVSPDTLATVQTTFERMLTILGLQLPAQAADLVRVAASGLTDEAIEQRVAERTALRGQKRWADADAVRQELAAQGVIIEDRAGGSVWHRVSVQ